MAVAGQLFTPETSDREHSREQLLGVVIPALMAAMDDYSVDNRCRRRSHHQWRKDIAILFVIDCNKNIVGVETELVVD